MNAITNIQTIKTDRFAVVKEILTTDSFYSYAFIASISFFNDTISVVILSILAFISEGDSTHNELATGI